MSIKNLEKYVYSWMVEQIVKKQTNKNNKYKK